MRIRTCGGAIGRVAALAAIMLATERMIAAAPEQPGPAFTGAQDDGRPRGRRGPMPFGQSMQPDYLRRDAPIIVDELGLDESQGFILETLIEDYLTAFAEAADRITERFQDARGGPEDAALRAKRQQFYEQARVLRQRARALRDEASGEEGVDRKALTELRREMQQLRQNLREARPTPPGGAERTRYLEQMTALGAQWRTERARLGQEFLENLRIILNEEQLERWPGLERRLRRDKTLQRGRLSGERVNLFWVVRDMDLQPEQRGALDDALRHYALALDEALAARNEFLETRQDELYQAMIAGDGGAAEAFRAREMELRVAVRDANDRGAAEIAAVLEQMASPEKAEAFRQDYRQRAFPRVYRPTRIQRALEGALELEGVDEQVRQDVADLQTTYLAELEAINQRLELTLREHEPAEDLQRLRRRVARMRGEDVARDRDNPMREAFMARSELDQRYGEQLRAMLSDGQVAQIPALRERRRRPPGPPDGRRGRRDF